LQAFGRGGQTHSCDGVTSRVPRSARGQRPSDALPMEWRKAAKNANLPGRIPYDFRRTAARNMERVAVPRSVAMALGGWRSESMYRRCAIDSEADLGDGARRLSHGDALPLRAGRSTLS
jgi:hypothetical protein